jgi:tRNA pseudouridine38-40 synthase
MLHQIRKMMGLLILVVRSSTPASLLPECYGPRKIHVPKAPSLGLLLDRPIFGSYNTNVRKDAFSAAKDPIDFEAYTEEIEEFRRRVIYEKLREEEEAADVFSGWLAGLDGLLGPDFDFLNPQGVIPPQSVRLSPKERAALAEQAGAETAAPAQEVGESDEELDGVDASTFKNAEMEG